MKKIELFKKLASCTIAQALLLFSMPVMPAVAENSTEQLYNIVLFAQFDSLSESNFMQERTEDIISMCNATDTFHSLSGYINAISYGQMQITSCFPQMQDDIIIPYVLSSSENNYQTCEQIAIEILKNITISDNIQMDGNGDGVIDNITLVVDGKADNMTSPLWARAFSLNGMKLNGYNVNRVNIQNSKQLFENQITGAEGVLCHEFLHSLGYPDLYRNNRTGTPVGAWDIMASDSVFLQYPLAYQRAKISNWLASEDITETGTYTIYPASSDNGNRLYLLKTPLSDTEFFAVEYRQQGARYSDELDVKIYGTGLVVYRVNTEIDGNFKSDKDEIYIFRPEETNLDAGEGNIFLSNYGGTNAPDSVGSLDWNADITDNALVYSNGTNSGIYIHDIIMNEKSLTFSVDFADVSDTKLWESVNHNLEDNKPYQLAVSEDNTVYLITADNSYAQLYKCDNNNLIKIGNPLGSGGYMDMNQPKLVCSGNTPYVLYQDKNFLLHICRYDVLSGIWTEIYKTTEIAQYADITADENKLYFTYTTGNFPYALNVACYDSQTEKSEIIGETIAENACNMSIAILNHNPVIAYRDINDANKPKLAIYENKNWNITTISDNACGTVSMTSDGNTAWIAPSGNGNAVYQFSNKKITAYPLPESISENIFTQIPVLIDDKCYLAVNTQNPDELSVYSLNDTTWEMTGNLLATDIVNSLSLAYSKQTLYCSYYTDNGTAIIRQLKLDSLNQNSRTGDVNADGKFDISDIVLLKKWILCVPDTTLADWQAGDLYQDGILDIFDLCRMQYMLLQQSEKNTNSAEYQNAPDTKAGEIAPTGDINADGEFAISDVVLLKKWILCVPDTTLVDWQEGDLCQDGVLDVFDLCRMQYMLSQKSNNNIINVTNSSELQNALENAKAGDEIVLASGNYIYNGKVNKGRTFTGTADGTENKPIILRSENPDNPAIIDGTTTESYYGLTITGDWWTVKDIIITNSSKGIILDNSNYIQIINCEVYNTGTEGIHIRDGSSNCIIDSCKVHDTGLVKAGYGEGIYIGSAESTTEYEHACDNNIIRNCKLGPNISAECIDVKEYTTGTIIEYCTFDGKGCSGENYAKAFVNIKGNDCILRYCTGYRNNCDKITRAFEQNDVVEGWGQNAYIYSNKVYMDIAKNADGKKMYFLNAWDCSCTVWDNYIAYDSDLVSIDNPDDQWNYYNSNFITYSDSSYEN
ncbi:MAG: right-handed parallel beta-helix repeat-containing protein [Ruminococcus sp.]|nr:right-handed parallel beta-helix repeat-containing protein [Ruminococcus sp.]